MSLQIGTIVELGFGKKATQVKGDTIVNPWPVVKGELYNPNADYKVPLLEWQLPYFKQGDKVYVNILTGHVVMIPPPWYIKKK
jgi:hypothetical protein